MMRTRAGLYLHDGRLTAAILTGRQAVETFTIEIGEQPGTRLKAELDARRLRVRRVRVGLARSQLTVKVIELPRTPTGVLKRMVRFELERHLPFPAEEAAWDFLELPSAAEKPHRVLVTACERRTVGRALRLLQEIKARPAAVTAACHDLPALIDRKMAARRVVWAHRAGDCTDLLFLGHGRLRLSRSVPIENGERLAAEVQASLPLVKWRDCEAIWISGDRAEELLFSPVLAKFIRSVTVPPWSADAQGLLELLPPEELGAALLALAAAMGSRIPSLNLLPVHLRPRTLSRGDLVTLGSASAAIVLGLGLLLAQDYQARRYLDRLSEATRALDPQVKAVERLSADVAGKKQVLVSILANEEGRLRPLQILREVTQLLPQDTWLSAMTLDNRGIELTGQAAAANQLIPLLESSPALERVELTSPVVKAGTREQFSIRANWERPSPASAAALIAPHPSVVRPERPATVPR
jgi:Tfp pilus assembly protein PilN